MSIEPKCPKILKAKAKQMTNSSQNIGCWQKMFKSRSPAKSPIRALQRMDEKQNQVLASFKQGTAKFPQTSHKEFVRSISPVAFQKNGSFQARLFVSPGRKPVMSPMAIQNQIQNRRSIQCFEKQQLFFKTRIDDMAQRIQVLEAENRSLKDRNLVLERKRAEGEKLVVLYNQKYNEAECLKSSLNSLHQTIFKQQRAMEISKSQIRESKQGRQARETKIAEEIVLGYKEIRLSSTSSKSESSNSKISEGHLIPPKQYDLTSEFSLRGKQTGFTSVSEQNIDEQMKKLRSVYEKPKSTFSKERAEFQAASSQPTEQIHTVIESQIQELRFQNLISVETIREDAEEYGAVSRSDIE